MDTAAQSDWDASWGSAPLPPMYFGFEVDTFQPLAELRDEVVTWLGGVRSAIVGPLVDRLAGQISHDYDRRACLGEPGLVSSDIVIWWSRRRSPAILDYGESAWAVAIDAIAKGGVKQVAVDVRRVAPDGHLDLAREQFRLSVDVSPEGALASRLRCHATPATYGGRVPVDVQRRFVDCASDAMMRLGGAWGGVFLDRETDELAFERATFRPSRMYGLRECDRFVRAYLWGNLLSRLHLDALGGIDTVLENAPFKVKRSIGDGGSRVYLQATNDVHDFDDVALKTVREYLAPVLPLPLDAEQDYVGIPLRLVHLDQDQGGPPQRK